MEEEGEYGSQTDQVIALDCVQITIVASPEHHHDVVEHIGRKDSGEELLHLEDEVSCFIVGEVTLLLSRHTLKTANRMQRAAKTTV